jgi:hypothetical protein
MLRPTKYSAPCLHAYKEERLRFRSLQRLANRIVLRILAAAFIVGLATLLSVYRLLGWENWAGVMFAVGFFFAIALGPGMK